MVDLWLTCKLRAPGDWPPGDGGPGGGGGGGGGCKVNCNGGGGCGTNQYWACNWKNPASCNPNCQSRSFLYDQIPDTDPNTCSWPSVFRDTADPDLFWYLDPVLCNQNCGKLCEAWVCEGDPITPPGGPGGGLGEVITPCTKKVVDSSFFCECTGYDVNKCPLGDCTVNGITYYQTQKRCEEKEPNCRWYDPPDRPPPHGGFCWECPDDPLNPCPCTLSCPQKYNLATKTWFCDPEDGCWDDVAGGQNQCNTTCSRACYGCGDDFDCTDITWVDCNTICPGGTFDTPEACLADPNCSEDEPCFPCDIFACVPGGCEWDNDTTTAGDCTNSKVVYDTGCTSQPPQNQDANCDGWTGVYQDNNGWYDEMEDALSEEGCVDCKDWLTCVPGTGGGAATCNQDCDGTFADSTTGCEYDTNCYKDNAECFQDPACECKDKIVCLNDIEGCEGNFTCETCTGTRNSTTGECDYNGSLTCGTCADAVAGAYADMPTCLISCQDIDDMCWECPGGGGTSCCTQTCQGTVLNGKVTCPTGCYAEDDEDGCNNNCFKKCCKCTEGLIKETWMCLESPVACSDLPDGDCEKQEVNPNEDWYNSCEDCAADEAGFCYDPESGESNNFNDNERAKDYVYAYDYVDDVYERNISNRTYFTSPTAFIPVLRGSLPSTLFKDAVHASIYAVYHMNNDADMLFSDIPYSNLSDEVIEKSLLTNIVSLLDKARLATGESMKPLFLGTVRRLLISNRLSDISVDELLELLNNVISLQDQYPATRGKGVGIPGAHFSEAEAIRLAGENSFPLKGDNYSGLVKERMKLWNTVATDLNKYLPVTLSTGISTYLYYSVGNIIPLGTGTLTMSPGDIQKVTLSDGVVKYFPVQGDFDRAYILQLEDIQRIIHLLGETYDFTLNVTTDEDLRLDERYGVTKERKNFYMLTPDFSTITDLERQNSFVSKTQVSYTYQSDGPTRNDWVKFRPWPFLTLYVDADDPIFTYITNTEENGEVTFTFKDFTFDLFEDDPEFKKYIRRIPTIILIPSNKDQNVNNHVISHQTDYGDRELVFTINPDPSRSDVWTAPHLEETIDDDGGVNPSSPDRDALSYSINTTDLTGIDKYTNGVVPIPRSKGGWRQILSNLKDLKDNYEITGNKVSWGQVYQGVDRSKMKFIENEVDDWPKFRSLLSLNKISSSTEVNTNYPKPLDVRSNDKTIENPTFNNYTYAQEKPPPAQAPTPID